MRLAQLARKLSVKPSEIVAILAQHQVVIDDNSNSKVLDEHVRIVNRHFGLPDGDELILEEIANPSIEEGQIENTEPTQEPNEIEPEKAEEEVERIVIKPQKVELPGLKVVGKIDLPEPKKKENTTALGAEPDPAVASDGRERNSKRSKRPDKKMYSNGPRKNPIALAREREEREAMKKKIEERERAKDARTQHYYNRLQQAQPQKHSKKKKKVNSDYEVYEPQAVREQPKTIFGKIWRWLKPPMD